MADMTTPGLFSWAELTTSEPAQAAEFYGSLFGWQFDTMAMPNGTYYVAANNGEQIAGIMAAPSQAHAASPTWGQYVTVGDVEATASKVEALGGKVLVPPTTIPGVGTFILLQDPQGACLSAIQYEAKSSGE